MIKVTKRRVIWIDVHLHSQAKRAELRMLKLWRAFLQWSLDENVMPAAKGHSGPLGFSNGYTPHDAKKVEAWLAAHGHPAESLWGRRRCI